jgi:hypothetical protein
LRIQSGNKLPCRNAIADVHRSLDNATANTKCKSDGFFRLDLAG